MPWQDRVWRFWTRIRRRRFAPPTRYGLLTGRYAWRTRLTRGVLNGYAGPLIAPNRETLGSFLGATGYRTAVIGKWHLGLGFAKNALGEFDFEEPH